MTNINQPLKDEDFRRYLAGQLSDAECEAFETAVLSSDEPVEDLAARVEAAEDEWVDDYVFGRLSRGQRSVFETRVSDSGRLRQKLQFARQLEKWANRGSSLQSFVQRLTAWLPAVRPLPYVYVGVTAALILLACIQYFLNLQLRESREQAAVEARQAVEARDALAARMNLETEALRSRLSEAEKRVSEAEANAARPAGSMASVAAMLLSPGLVRSSGQTARLNLNEETIVELALDIGIIEFPTYSVSVLDANGKQVVDLYQLRARESAAGAEVPVRLPAGQIPPGDYLLVLSGVGSDGSSERLDSYNVRIAR